ncbi:unnamed protein product [Caenorhabditis nigoni]
MDSILSDAPPSYEEAVRENSNPPSESDTLEARRPRRLRAQDQFDWERFVFTKSNFFIFWCLLMITISTAFYQLRIFHVVAHMLLSGLYISFIFAAHLQKHFVLSVVRRATFFLALVTTMITVIGIITVEYVLEDDLKPFTATLLIGSIFKFWTNTWRSENIQGG